MDDQSNPTLPTTFKVLCIVGLVLGTAGFCCTVTSGASLLFADAQRSMIERMAHDHPNDPALQSQQEAYRVSQRVQNKWRVVNMISVPANAISSIVLILGISLALSRKRLGPPILIGASVVHLLFGAFTVLVGYLSFHDAQEIIDTTMRGAARGTHLSQGVAHDIVNTLTVASVVIAFAWLVAKSVFFGALIYHARKPAVRQLMS